MKIVAFILAVTVLAASGPAAAQTGDPGIRQNCAGDYFRLCSMVNPFARADVERCFDSRRRELSPACNAAINDFNRRQAAERRPQRRTR